MAGGSLRNVSSHIFRWWHHQKVGSPLRERGSHPGGLPSVEVSHEASGRCGAFPVARILPGLQQHLPIPISPILPLLPILPTLPLLPILPILPTLPISPILVIKVILVILVML